MGPFLPGGPMPCPVWPAPAWPALAWPVPAWTVLAWTILAWPVPAPSCSRPGSYWIISAIFSSPAPMKIFAWWQISPEFIRNQSKLDHKQVFQRNCPHHASYTRMRMEAFSLELFGMIQPYRKSSGIFGFFACLQNSHGGKFTKTGQYNPTALRSTPAACKAHRVSCAACR